MNDINSPKPKEQKLIPIGKHLYLIAWMIGFQTLLILSVGLAVTFKGCLIFLLQIGTYLMFHYWVIPLFFNKKTRLLFLLRISSLIGLYFIIRGLISFHGKSVADFLYFILSYNQFLYTTAHLTIIIGLNFFIGLYKRNEQLLQEYYKALEEKLEAITEKARIESIVTQMRLSPHLMFNTLNYIQQKADGIVPEIVRAVDLFSGIVHHSMTNILETKTILLSKEIEKVKDQIELHGLLSDGRVYLDFEEEYNGAIDNAMIPPSTLLTFIENVFRYGIVKDPDYRPSIKVKMEGRQFTFSTWNYKKRNPHAGAGMGIKSVASTLGYYYPGLHILHIENLEETFRLTLTIQL